MKNEPRLFVVSLGCPKNLVDTEVILGQLLPAGYRLEADPQSADAILINTCSFIEPARQETLDTIAEYIKLKRHSRAKALIVTGCMAESHRHLLEEHFPEIDAILSFADQAAIAQTLARLLPKQKARKAKSLGVQASVRVTLTPPHTSYLRISDGCDRACSFCIIPKIRGPYHSRPMPEILSEAASLASSGTKELNLISQDTTYYGRERGGERLLPELLQRLCQVEGIEWIRVMYAFPSDVTDELLDVMAREKKICPYLDLPLQHASEPILKAMRRPNQTEELENLIRKIRSAVPGIFLRTAFIVGFPGETDADFECLLNFCKRMEFDYVGTFLYSNEEGSPAALLPNPVPPEIQEERHARLVKIVRTLSEQRVARLVGKDMDILIDGESDVFPDYWKGRHAGQAPDIDGVVYVPRRGAAPGQIAHCRLTASLGYDLFAGGS